MALAMAKCRKVWQESLLDQVDTFSPGCDRRFSRVSSDLSKSSSSPDSTYGTQETFPSRQSSISSVSSSTCALAGPQLPSKAMRRCANVQPRTCSLASQNITSDKVMSWNDPFSMSRTRESSPARSLLSSEVTPRPIIPPSPMSEAPCGKTYEAASALCELNPDRGLQNQRTSCERSRKRERPHSIDHGLHSVVRDLVTPGDSEEFLERTRDMNAVVTDQKSAKTWLLQHRSGRHTSFEAWLVKSYASIRTTPIGIPLSAISLRTRRPTITSYRGRKHA